MSKTLITEEQYDDIVSLMKQNDTMLEMALYLASRGIKVFPAVAWDKERYESCHAEYLAEKAKPAADRDKKKAEQGYYKRYGGKAPPFRDQYKKATTDEATIREWWGRGKAYEGRNICLATGEDSGLVVLDIDVKSGEDDGFLWWNELTAKHGDIATLKVRTGGESQGGQHLYFLWREGAVSRNGLAPGIDFRSNDGHVMAPLSMCQGVYEIVSFDPVAEMPDWLLDEVSGQAKKKAPSKSRVKAKAGADPEATQSTKEASKRIEFMEPEEEERERDLVPLDQIADMLEWVDLQSVGGKGWMQIAYAIHSEHPTEEGFLALDAWSQTDEDGYDLENNRSIWNRASEDKNNGTTISSLFFYADEAGWINPNRGETYVNLPKAIKMMNRSYAMIDRDLYTAQEARRGRYVDTSLFPPGFYPSGIIFKDRAIISSEDDPIIADYHKMEEVAPWQMDMATATYRVVKKTQSGKEVTMSLRDAWLKSPARKAYASAGFFVDPKNVPAGVVNLFPGWKVRPKEGRPEAFMGHVRDIICSGNEEHMFWIMNRLAFMVQFGDKACSTALVITGNHGSGKTIIGDYLERMLGDLSYKYLHDAEGIKSRFTEELIGKFVVLADEAIFAGDPQVRNKLKSLIGAKIMRDEGKGKAVKDAQNVMFLIVLSNEDVPIGIERGDRRFTIFATDDKFSQEKRDADKAVDKEAKKHFNDLVKEMHGDGPSKLLHYLLNFDVQPDIARTALKTKQKQNMAEARSISCDSLVAFLYHMYSVGDEGTGGEGDVDATMWGVRLRTGKFYEEYCDWVAKQKSNHRNSEWKALATHQFTARLTADFDCQFIRPQGKSHVVFPMRDAMAVRLRQFIPEIMAVQDKAEKDMEQAATDKVFHPDF